MSWWDSIEQVSKFNTYMQIAIVLFGFLTASATYLSNKAANRISDLQSKKEVKTQQRLEATEAANKVLQDELNNKFKISENHTKNLSEYGEVAALNFNGAKSVSNSHSVPSPLSGWNDKYVRETSDGKQIRYDDEAIAYYKKLQEAYPKYPFSYYCLAEAYRLRGDNKWRDYAKQAIKILNITTTLPNHAPNHDEALASLRNMLSQHAKP